MKYLLLSGLIILSLSANTQVDVIIGIGSSADSEQTIAHSYERTSISPLTPPDPTKALSETVQVSRGYITSSTKAQQLELGLGYTGSLTGNLRYRLAATMLRSSSDIGTTSTFQTEVLSSEVVDYAWPAGSGGTFSSNCDEFTLSEDYFDMRDAPKALNITSLNIFAGLEYYFARVAVSIGSTIYVRTPLRASEEVFMSDFERIEVDGQVICRNEGRVETVHRVDDLSYMQLGIAPYVAYHFTDQLRLQAGVRYSFDDTFYREELSDGFLFNSPRSLQALETHIQVSYVFGRMENSTQEEIVQP